MGVYSLSKSSVNNWVKYSNAAAGNGQTSDMELISTQLLTSTQASVAFNNLQNYNQYKHLQLRLITRNLSGDSAQDIYLRVNNDAVAGNYAYHALYGTGSAAGSEASFTPSGARVAQSPASAFTANVFFPAIIDILDFSSSVKNKTMRTMSGNTGTYNRAWFSSNAWFNTVPITSLTLVTANGSSFLAGSRFSLYGIK